MNDYLNLPPHQRKLLAGSEEKPRRKTEAKEANRPPLPLGETPLIKPVANCNHCGFTKGDITHNEVVYMRVYGCPDCGRIISIVDLWE